MISYNLGIFSIILGTQYSVIISSCFLNISNSSFNHFINFITINLYIFGFILLQVLFLNLPGKKYIGPTSSDLRQIVPYYKENGVKAFLLTNLLTQFMINYKIINPLKIYENIGILLLSLNFYALVLCYYLYLSAKEKGFNDYNNKLQRFYLGQELYPMFSNINIKFFTNCRFGMMLWSVLLVIYMNCQSILYNSINTSMYVNFCLQMIYIFKFYKWEKGYTYSLDIMHDKAGYYICWGCIVWVPFFYAMTSYYLVSNSGTNSLISILLFIIGILSIGINYWADYQRKKFRETGGTCKIFGKPAKFMHGIYIENGLTKQNLLLINGFWGMARHFNYLPELIASYSWCLCCNSIYGLFYPIYLTILLVHRAERDATKCKDKYINWNNYCNKVHYKIIPYVY